MFADKSGASFTDHNTLIAVNSKGNIRDTNYNMRLDLDEVREFLQSVADQYDLQIFGVNAKPDQPDEPPPDDDEPPPPPSLDKVWSELAKDHRSTAAHHEKKAEYYEGLIEKADNGGGNGYNPGGFFG